MMVTSALWERLFLSVTVRLNLSLWLSAGAVKLAVSVVGLVRVISGVCAASGSESNTCCQR